MLKFALASVLLAFWLLLSGHYSTLLLSLGAISIVLAIYVASRMGVLDEEGLPIHMVSGIPAYHPWLLVEIVKSAWTVTRIVLGPKSMLTPELVTVRTQLKTPLGAATFGNSITLTPGTITIKVTTLADGHELLVHALTHEGAADLKAGGMDQRVMRFEAAAIGARERAAGAAQPEGKI